MTKKIFLSPIFTFLFFIGIALSPIIPKHAEAVDCTITNPDGSCQTGCIRLGSGLTCSPSTNPPPTQTPTPAPPPASGPVACGTYPNCNPGCTGSALTQKCELDAGTPPPPPAGSNAAICGSLGLIARDGLCFPPEVVTGETGSLVASRTVGDLIKTVINILLVLVGALSVLFLVIGAVLYLTSAGNTTQAGKGKQTMLSAVFGLMITALAYTIVTISYNLITKGSVF